MRVRLGGGGGLVDAARKEQTREARLQRGVHGGTRRRDTHDRALLAEQKADELARGDEDVAIAAVLGPSFANIVVALAVIMWARYARIIRSQILQVREEDYVDAARVIGASRFGIIRKEILPNSFTPVAVQATLDMGHAVLLGATLAFIGLAVAGQAEWGTLVSEGQADIVAGRWWTSTFPGLMVFLWALSFNLVGDGLRDVLDPRTEGR